MWYFSILVLPESQTSTSWETFKKETRVEDETVLNSRRSKFNSKPQKILGECSRCKLGSPNLRRQGTEIFFRQARKYIIFALLCPHCERWYGINKIETWQRNITFQIIKIQKSKISHSKLETGNCKKAVDLQWHILMWRTPNGAQKKLKKKCTHICL